MTDTASDLTFLSDLPLAGTLVATDFDGWTPELRAEFAAHAHDGQVGSRLLSENDRVRVWEIRLAPGERWHAHRHVLDYFWTAVNAGRSRQHTHRRHHPRGVVLRRRDPALPLSGRASTCCTTSRTSATAELIFTTVEHLDGANAPLPLSDGPRT